MELRRGLRRLGSGAAAALELLLEALEHAHDPQPAVAIRSRRRAVFDRRDEVFALQSQGLGVQYLRRVDVAAAGYVLAVRARALVEALVVDGQLSLRRHVVERGHALGAHD